MPGVPIGTTNPPEKKVVTNFQVVPAPTHFQKNEKISARLPSSRNVPESRRLAFLFLLSDQYPHARPMSSQATPKNILRFIA
jgi:hypothetical protein